MIVTAKLASEFIQKVFENNSFEEFISELVTMPKDSRLTDKSSHKQD